MVVVGRGDFTAVFCTIGTIGMLGLTMNLLSIALPIMLTSLTTWPGTKR